MGAATDAAQSGEVYLGAAAAELLRLGDADEMAPLPDELNWGCRAAVQLRSADATRVRASPASARSAAAASPSPAPRRRRAHAAAARLLGFLRPSSATSCRRPRRGRRARWCAAALRRGQVDCVCC